MTEEPQPEKSSAVHGAGKGVNHTPPVAAIPLPVGAVASGTAETLGVPPPVDKLTPDEQMALFEKELKEKDWGHQPC